MNFDILAILIIIAITTGIFISVVKFIDIQNKNISSLINIVFIFLIISGLIFGIIFSTIQKKERLREKIVDLYSTAPNFYEPLKKYSSNDLENARGSLQRVEEWNEECFKIVLDDPELTEFFEQALSNKRYKDLIRIYPKEDLTVKYINYCSIPVHHWIVEQLGPINLGGYANKN